MQFGFPNIKMWKKNELSSSNFNWKDYLLKICLMQAITYANCLANQNMWTDEIRWKLRQRIVD